MPIAIIDKTNKTFNYLEEYAKLNLPKMPVKEQNEFYSNEWEEAKYELLKYIEEKGNNYPINVDLGPATNEKGNFLGNVTLDLNYAYIMRVPAYDGINDKDSYFPTIIIPINTINKNGYIVHQIGDTWNIELSYGDSDLWNTGSVEIETYVPETSSYTAEPLTAIYSVNATNADGKTIYSDIAIANLKSGSTNSISVTNNIDKISVGATVNIKLLYWSPHMQLLNEQEQIVTIEQNQETYCAFEFTLDPTVGRNVAGINKYEFTEEGLTYNCKETKIEGSGLSTTTSYSDKNIKTVIKNTSGNRYYVRVKAITTDDVQVNYNGANWNQQDSEGYWYYERLLASGIDTTEINFAIENAGIQKNKFNVAIVIEYTPVLYDAAGRPYADWTAITEEGRSLNIEVVSKKLPPKFIICRKASYRSSKAKWNRKIYKMY